MRGHHSLDVALLSSLIFLSLGVTSCTVYLTTNDNLTFIFEDADADFGGIIPSSGIYGTLVQATPLDACDALSNPVVLKLFSSTNSIFALVQRGGCVFDTKVRNAQDAGYSAVVVFNDEPGLDLITMSGRSSEGITIPSVFVTYDSGRQLQNLLTEGNSDCFISPTFENTAWSVMAVSFMSLMAVAAILATFFFVRRNRLRQFGNMLLSREQGGMSTMEVKQLPVSIFESSDGNAGCNNDICAICLEDYEDGDKLRVLPCKHEFHVACVDQWLTTRRPFCPVCKRDARHAEGSEYVDSEPSLSSEIVPHPPLPYVFDPLSIAVVSTPAEQASQGSPSLQDTSPSQPLISSDRSDRIQSSAPQYSSDEDSD